MVEDRKDFSEEPMSVLDVAAYILQKQPVDDPITTWKFQKLVYYCQAWSLVWDEQPLFNEKILAWANGPVVKELYDQHKGLFYIKEITKGNPDRLSANQKDTIDQVLKAYGTKSGQWLSDLTHMEKPWIEARNGVLPGERSQNEIQLATMHEYYSWIDIEGSPIKS